MRWVIGEVMRLSDASCVTVKDSLTRIAWRGGAPRNPASNQATFSLPELLAWMAAGSRLQRTSIEKWPVQMAGLPIGSPASKIGCSVKMAFDESTWQADLPRLQLHRFLRPGEKWCDIVASARYVDDICHCSLCLCESCLLEAQSLLTAVPFDLVSSTADGPTNSTATAPSSGPPAPSVSWLDIAISFQTDSALRVHWAPRQISTPPAWDVPFPALKAYLTGRIHRWAELQLPDSDVPVVSAKLIDGLLQCGWQRKHFQWCQWAIPLGSHCKYRLGFVTVLRRWLATPRPAEPQGVAPHPPRSR